MPDPKEVLRTTTIYGLIGATQDKLKYSYELLFTLLDAGVTVYPINPRYQNIEAHRCYPSVSELPQKPEVIIIAMVPKNAEAMIESVAAQSIPIVWLPPGSWSEEAVAKAEAFGLEVLYDVCPIGTLKMMESKKQ